MWHELKTLFWLQWRLTLSIFRPRRTSDVLRILFFLSRIPVFLFTFPTFVLMGLGLAVALISMPSGAAYEMAMIVNTFLFFAWLLLPSSYNSQIVERFEMARLFAHPIRFRTIVVGSVLMSALTMTGMWTIPILLGEIVGLAWHQPLALPLILAGAVPIFALLVLTGRIMDDFFDLVAGDRRLRAVALALLSLPFMLCWLGQYVVQNATDNYSQLPSYLQFSGMEELTHLEEPSSFGEFLSTSGRVLEIVQVSRFLIWTPPGWTTAGMALALRGEWQRGSLFLASSVAFTAMLLWGHAHITRRLMEGAALRVGVERVRSRKFRIHLPGSRAFWALFRKDWVYLWRSPMPRRLLFSSLMIVVAVAFPLRDIADRALPEGAADVPPTEIQRTVPLIAFAFAATLIGMGINMVMTANYFGTFDREGFTTLSASPVDRRYTLLSANLAVLLYVMAQHAVLSVAIALLTRSWDVLSVGLFFGLCLQISSTPVCSVAAVLAPYRTQLKFGNRRQHANLWGLAAWLISALPVSAMILLPAIFWRPGLVLTLPLALVYSGVLYALTLNPLARLLQRREHNILRAITEQE